ncbi:hypothetical protein PRO82_002206 [Candidatus Protochlamydia amoebophila]|nr:hypothetical protein [Candidatus Protochlamydia amoebophila]
MKVGSLSYSEHQFAFAGAQMHEQERALLEKEESALL